MASRLPATEKVRRDDRIVADRARGLTWATIAERHGVSDRQARAIWKERLTAEPLESLDGLDAITEALLQVEAAIEDLALLAETTRNDPVRLGAIRARLEAQRDRVTLLRLGGYMPATWRAAMTEADIRRMTDTFGEIFRRDDVSDELLHDLIAALGEPVLRTNGHR